MGRTLHTYRTRLNMIKQEMSSVLKNFLNREKMDDYSELWGLAVNISYAGSTIPYPDTRAIATYSMLLQLMGKVDELENAILKNTGLQKERE